VIKIKQYMLAATLMNMLTLPLDNLFAGNQFSAMKAEKPATTKRNSRTKKDAALKQVNKQLHVAASTGDTEALVEALRAGAQINATDVHGRSALTQASDNGHTAAVAMLLNAKADTSLCDDYNGVDDFYITALHQAVEHGHQDIITLLLAAGADIDAQTWNGRTALMYASYSGDRTATDMLLKAKANTELCGRDNLGALGIAAVCGNDTIIKLLLDAGAHTNLDTDIPTVPESLTPLQWAIAGWIGAMNEEFAHSSGEHNWPEVAGRLVMAGARITCLGEAESKFDMEKVTPEMLSIIQEADELRRELESEHDWISEELSQLLSPHFIPIPDVGLIVCTYAMPQSANPCLNMLMQEELEKRSTARKAKMAQKEEDAL
jgi:hypothetical protein